MSLVMEERMKPHDKSSSANTSSRRGRQRYVLAEGKGCDLTSALEDSRLLQHRAHMFVIYSKNSLKKCAYKSKNW